MTDLRYMAEQAVADSFRWFPKVADRPFFTAACLAGEIGEVLNLLKKVERGSHQWTPEMQQQVEEEIADVFTYLLHFVGMLGIDLESAYWDKRKINATRFSARQVLEGPDQQTQIIPKVCVRPDCDCDGRNHP